MKPEKPGNPVNVSRFRPDGIVQQPHLIPHTIEQSRLWLDVRLRTAGYSERSAATLSVSKGHLSQSRLTSDCIIFRPKRRNVTSASTWKPRVALSLRI